MSLKRVAIQVAKKGATGSGASWPQNYPRKRDVFVLVTQNFVTAFGLTAVQPTFQPEEIGPPGKKKWKLPGSPGKYSQSYRFWKVVNNERKAFAAPMGSLPVFMVIAFAKTLQGCVGVTTPAGRSYFFQ